MNLDNYFEKNEDSTFRIDFSDPIFSTIMSEYDANLSIDENKIKITEKFTNTTGSDQKDNITLTIKLAIFIIYWLAVASSNLEIQSEFKKFNCQYSNGKLSLLDVPSNFIEILTASSQRESICV